MPETKNKNSKSYLIFYVRDGLANQDSPFPSLFIHLEDHLTQLVPHVLIFRGVASRHLTASERSSSRMTHRKYNLLFSKDLALIIYLQCDKSTTISIKSCQNEKGKEIVSKLNVSIRQSENATLSGPYDLKLANHTPRCFRLVCGLRSQSWPASYRFHEIKHSFTGDNDRPRKSKCLMSLCRTVYFLQLWWIKRRTFHKQPCWSIFLLTLFFVAGSQILPIFSQLLTSLVGLCLSA